jgi:hypothetical protein
MLEAQLTLTRSAAAWNSAEFGVTLADEVGALGPHHAALRPLLQAALTQTSAVADAPVSVQILRLDKTADRVRLRLGLFYAGVIAGCNCADDPTPVDTITEHCELLLDLDPATGRATLTSCAD